MLKYYSSYTSNQQHSTFWYFIAQDDDLEYNKNLAPWIFDSQSLHLVNFMNFLPLCSP